VLKNPFYDFHSMFQQFNPSIRSTLHRVTFAFVDWQLQKQEIKKNKGRRYTQPVKEHNVSNAY